MTPFDPYHKWLGIPPKEQPANYYRLLGIEEFEADADVIEGAAERQTIYLRTFQTGPNSELAARLLNEVSAARVCLLDETSKTLYDADLRSDLQTAPEEDPLALMTEELAAISSKPVTQSRSRSGKPVWQQPWAISVGTVGIIMVLLLVIVFFGSGEEPQDRANQSTNTTAGNQQKTQPTANNEAAPDKVAVAPPPAVAPFDAAEAKAHQAAWAKYLGVPVEYTNSIGMKFMLIPPGEFMMGAVDGQSGNLRYRNRDAPNTPSHLVKHTRAFYLGATEVTRGEWGQINANTFDLTDRLPVNRVNYHDVTQFTKQLSERENTSHGPAFANPPNYRLPTEAEWEYAARAGTVQDHFAGNTLDSVAKYEWTKGTSFMKVKPVATKLPNPWRLFDVGGNLNEWCLNRGSHTFFKKDVVTIDPQGPRSGDRRALRSGSTHYDQFPL